MGSLLRVPDPAVVKEQLSSLLSASPFTVDSIYGVLILCVIVGLVIKFFHNIGKCVRFIIGFLVLWELSHVIVTETPLGTWMPVLGRFFKFDVLTAFAQMCVGTPVSGALLWIQAYLNTVVGGAFSTIFHIIAVFCHWLHVSTWC